MGRLPGRPIVASWVLTDHRETGLVGDPDPIARDLVGLGSVDIHRVQMRGIDAWTAVD